MNHPFMHRQKHLASLILSFTLVCTASCFSVSASVFSLPLKLPVDTVPGNNIADTTNPDTAATVFDVPASYPGGQRAWLKYIVENTRLSQSGVQGSVIVSFNVDEKGRLSNFVAISGPDELKKEAVRLMKHSGKWNPATLKGTPVFSQYQQKITFQWFYN